MKKILAILAIALLTGIATRAQNYSVTVTTNSTDLVPQLALYSTTAWTNGLVVANGDFIVNTNSPAKTYWTPNGGTSTNMPTHTYGISTGTDTVTWLRLNTKKSRENAIVFGDIDTTVFYSKDGQDATTSAGVLDVTRPARGFPGHQGGVKGIVASGTATVTVELDH